MNSDSKIKELLKHFSVYGMGSIAQAATGFILLPIITSHMVPADYGTYTLINLAGLLAGTVFYFGITSALPRSFFDYDSEIERNRVLSTGLMLILAGAFLQILLGYLLGGAISNILFHSREFANQITVMFFAAAVAFINTFFQTYFRLLNKSKTVVSQGLIASFVNFFVAISLFKTTTLTIWVPILSFFISQIIICVHSLFLARRQLSMKLHKKEVELMLKFGIPTIVTALTVMALEWSDRFFLNKFLSLSDVGIYSLAYKFGSLINPLLILPFTQIWNPLMMKYRSNDDIKPFFNRVMTYYILAGSLFALGASCFFNEIVFLFVKNTEYHKGVFLIPLIMTGVMIYGSSNILSAGFLYSRKLTEIPIIYFCFAVLNFGLNYTLIPRLGYVGAAISSATSYSLIPFVIYWRSSRFFSFKIDFKKSLTIMIINGVLILLALASNRLTLIERVGCKLIFVVVGITLSLLTVFTKKELLDFNKYFKKQSTT